MKLRIKGHTIRIRLQQQELADLEQKGFIQDYISFGAIPDNTLVYRLELSDTDTLIADFSDRRICIGIPRETVLEMIHTDRVGIAGDKQINERETLSMLIEKDFKCLTHRGEDIDAFAHPDASIGHSS